MALTIRYSLWCKEARQAGALSLPAIDGEAN